MYFRQLFLMHFKHTNDIRCTDITSRAIIGDDTPFEGSSSNQRHCDVRVGSIPKELGRLTALIGLELQGNKLTGEISGRYIHDVRNFLKIFLHSNRIDPNTTGSVYRSYYCIKSCVVSVSRSHPYSAK